MTVSSALRDEVDRARRELPFLGALGWAPIIAECSWIIDNLDDVESDLSAFHRVDDYTTLPSARFFAFALRLGAYSGAVQARELARQEAANPTPKHAAGKPIETTEAAAFAQLEAAGLLEREVA